MDHPWVRSWSETSPLQSCHRMTPTPLLRHYGDLGGFTFPIHAHKPVVQRQFNLVRERTPGGCAYTIICGASPVFATFLEA